MKHTKSKNSSTSKININNIDLQTPIRKFLSDIGENPKRDGLKDTPARFEESIKHILSGYSRNFEEEKRLFENKPVYKGMIMLKNIDFFSMCEHHLLPFFGYAHIAYIPSSKVYLGISKLARVVDIYARRLQTQEQLETQIVGALMRDGKAKGVAILIESRHLCAQARGVEKKSSVMSTCAFYGSLEKDQKQQQHFMDMVRDREKVV